jgi:hypothetical protein
MVYDFYTDNVEWTPPQVQSALELTSANVHGDVRDELVWIDRDGVVSVLDAATEQLIWQSAPLSDARGLIVADLDGNGYAEILARTSLEIVLFEQAPIFDPFQMGASFSSDLDVVDVVAGDTDGDGLLEIYALLDPPNPQEPHRIVQLGNRLQHGPWFTLPWPAQLITIEESPFARKNLLVSRTEGDLVAGRLVTIDARNGGIVSESPPLIGGIARNGVHYVDTGSGVLRLSIGTDAGMYLTR